MGVTRGILQRTFRIRYGGAIGTCFTVDVANRRYLVTARHIAGTVSYSVDIEIKHEGIWKPVPVRLVGHGDGDIDVSVLAPQYPFGGSEVLTFPAPMTLGEDVYFLGFPFGMSMETGDLNLNLPLPFVKKATLSAFTDVGQVLLDGHNNPGFSGGPVVDSSGDRVIGVISGYRHDRKNVLDCSGDKGPYTYDMNTGIIHAWDSFQINQLILNNPIGIPVDDSAVTSP